MTPEASSPPAGSALAASAAEAPKAAAKPRMEYLDIVKGFAALSVVLLHLLSSKEIYAVLAPWHIWQAVPIFMLVAGITGALSYRKIPADWGKYWRSLPKKAWDLYLPYAAGVFIFYIFQGSFGLRNFIETLAFGYLGPGGYFVPLIVQHLIFFPLILALRDWTRTEAFRSLPVPKILAPYVRNPEHSDLCFLAITFALTFLAELPFAFVDPKATSFLYRVFYFRYLFVCALGAVLMDKNPIPARLWRFLVLFSAVYMGLTAYADWNFFFITKDWVFQHYPAFFYTAALVFFVRDHADRIPFRATLMKLGKSSYDIFIFQLFFFVLTGNTFRSGFFMQVLGFALCLGGGLGFTWCKAKWPVWTAPRWPEK